MDLVVKHDVARTHPQKSLSIHNHIFAGSEQEVMIDDVKVHQYFNTITQTDDIALVILSDDVKYTKVVTPACLPQHKEELKAGTTCTVTGTRFFHKKPVYKKPGLESPKS